VRQAIPPHSLGALPRDSPQLMRGPLGGCLRGYVAIQIPEDLEALKALAATHPLAPATVFIEPGRHPGAESGELPVVRLEIEEENTYVQFLTFPDGSAESFGRSITISDVVTQLRQFVTADAERELFWVSGFIPLVEDGTPDDTDAYARVSPAGSSCCSRGARASSLSCTHRLTSACRLSALQFRGT
jgi:hypothetical protein